MNSQKTYKRIAWFYDILDLPFEVCRYRHLRRTLFSGLSGALLDAGVGTGRNFPFYPDDCTVTGIDISPAMLDRARRRKDKLGTVVELREMNVTAMDVADDSFDSIVSTFLFCVLEPELQRPALEELRRVCRPDGTIYILEYAISENPLRRFIMNLWAPWVRLAYGAAFDRHTEQYLEAAGLNLVKKKYLYKDIIKLLLVRPKAL
ncbi:MAG: class I SAM-dependent methyltransferase [Rhodospirillales bacterium]|nr:class I SAM-dependent methyltransferase [Rhodospirillales bacterium]MBT4039336.1 class I SAM-dependent methyltransferase [Rhodospirillales bacterium]MBT4626262.1 class I SAM-dependent methyltransferase [Rhodospirillales bacterium]MBT5353069.1 class I SAM-dependent methyltransferase [Rhodospirillales bacterium]MBT5520756.1 class I SAM-dependent methyltransferase [Rhodospirillales bacterium]